MSTSTVPSRTMAQRAGDARHDGATSHEQQLVFRCRDRECDQLRVEREATRDTTMRSYLNCRCEEGHEEAAICESVRVERIRESGHLRDDHEWAKEEFEVLDSHYEEPWRDVYCESCFAQAGPEAWFLEGIKPADVVDAEEEFFVRCDQCGREVEFGWRHEGRGGPAFPCEASDFDPRTCVPEPRYWQAWAQRGWIAT